MKRTNNFTLAALAVLCLVGCTQDDERTAAGLPMTGTPMRVVAHVDAPVTREAMTTADLTHYYFRVTDADGGTDEYNYFTTMTLENDQWTGDKTMTWQSTFPQVSALEQKGVNWSETDYTTGKDVSVETDQSDRNNLLKSDLLYMTPKTISATDLDNEGNIKVNLAHLFAKLKVVVTVTGVPFNPIKSLVVGGTKTTARFTPETGELGAVSGEATAITACQDGTTTTYECILLPQDVAANTLSVTASTAQGEKKYLHSASLTLKGNYQYTLTLNMAYNGTMSPSGDVNVGEWGEENIGGGELEEGAEISEDGTYYVSTARGLLEWAKAVQDDSSLNLTLTKDIDMTGKTWPAIESYSGTIDGGGYTIKNLTLTTVAQNSVGLIINGNSCTIRNLTLLNPSIYASYVSNGFLIGGMATDCTIENCHVIGGTTNDEYTKSNLVHYATGCKFTACSVTSSGASMINRAPNGDVSITACYVTGGKFVGSVLRNEPTYTASYYQNGGDITSAEDESTETSWSAAAEKMNTELSGTAYQWVENEGTDATERPLVIKPQTTE